MTRLFTEKFKMLCRAPKLGTGCVSLQDDCSSMTTYSRKIEDYLDKLEEGAWVCDKYDCEDIMFVMSGPMCDTKLQDDEVSKFSDLNIENSLFAQSVMSDRGNAYGSALKYAKIQEKAGVEYNSLDSVSMKEYCRLWKEKGARIGRFFNREIKWEI